MNHSNSFHDRIASGGGRSNGARDFLSGSTVMRKINSWRQMSRFFRSQSGFDLGQAVRSARISGIQAQCFLKLMLRAVKVTQFGEGQTQVQIRNGKGRV